MKTNRLNQSYLILQKNSSSAIEDVMAELRNLKLLVDEGILTEEEFQQKETAIASIRLIKKS